MTWLSTSRGASAERRPRFTGAAARRLPAGIALISVCLFGMVALPYWSAHESHAMHRELRDTVTPLEVSLARLKYNVLGIATDLRGFVLTGDPSFLGDFEQEHAAVIADLDRAATLARDLGVPFRGEIAAARRDYMNWLVHSRVLAVLGRATDAQTAKEQELSGTSLRMRARLSERIERLEARLRAREEGLRQRLAGFQAVEQWLMMVLGGLAAVVVGYLAYLAVSLLRAERTAVEERDQLQAVLAAVDSGILLMDREMRVLAANERASELLAVPSWKLIGSDQRTIVRETLGPRMTAPEVFQKRLSHLYDNPEAVAEDMLELREPERRTLLRYSAPVWDGIGTVSGRIEVYRDVTEWLRRERELAETNDRKDRFMATLSHELRTPLAPIFAWIELLKGERNPARLERGLSAIRRNVALEAQLVEDLFELSMVVNQKVELDLQPMDVVVAIRAAVDTVQHLAKEKDVQLEVRFPDPAISIVADETRFMQIVWNLLSNAIKFSHPGGRILLEARDASERLEVAVTDEGEGIPPALLDHIFKPFEQASERGRAARGGLGVGLALSRSLVELHGGEITARSAGSGRGAQFTFWIPTIPRDGRQRRVKGLRVEDETEALPLEGTISTGVRLTPRVGRVAGPDLPDAAPKAITPAEPAQGGSILVVEDNLDTLEAMRRLLTSWGYRVVATDNVPEALATVRGTSFDAIISDIGMPNVDGLSFAREVRAMLDERDSSERPPLIAISGYASHSDRQRALEGGFDAYITKPIDFESLRGLLEQLDPSRLEVLRA
jgi:signal transduction histidine kinase/CheY-like chemotaxis protein